MNKMRGVMAVIFVIFAFLGYAFFAEYRVVTDGVKAVLGNAGVLRAFGITSVGVALAAFVFFASSFFRIEVTPDGHICHHDEHPHWRAIKHFRDLGAVGIGFCFVWWLTAIICTNAVAAAVLLWIYAPDLYHAVMQKTTFVLISAGVLLSIFSFVWWIVRHATDRACNIMLVLGVAALIAFPVSVLMGEGAHSFSFAFLAYLKMVGIGFGIALTVVAAIWGMTTYILSLKNTRVGRRFVQFVAIMCPIYTSPSCRRD